MSDAEVHHLPARSGGPDPARVASRVLDTMDVLVERLGEAYREVPEYAALGPTVMRDEVLVVSRQIVEGFLRAVVEHRQPDPAAIGVIAEMGRRRLEMGVPLEPMLHVYRICGRVVWEAVAAAVEPGRETVLAELGSRWIDYMDRAASLAAAAYLAASTDHIRALDARRQAIVEALLGATTPAEVAAVSIRFSVVLAPAYSAVVAEGDEVTTGVDRVLRTAPEGTLGGFRSGRLVLLVPDGPADLGDVWRAAGRPHLAWEPPTPPGPDLLAAVGRAEELLATALVAGTEAGIFGPDDLLVERLLAAHEDVAEVLHRRVVQPLTAADHDGILVSTLRTYLATGSVPETARREYVHPNTVLYRLRRVREVTGYDARVPVDAARLVLALGGAT